MIINKVKEAIKRYGLINPKDKIIVGVSGGPDSVALLYLLNSLRQDLKISLHIAHLDHMLRKDSPKDRKFVEGLAKKLKIPITSAAINVAALIKRGSPEEIARNVRLGFLFRVARQNKARKIALAHNFDDQAETVLMRILRGAGLYGLSGILPKKDISGFMIIRPLIETRRSDIEAFLKRKRIKPRIDKTNLQNVYFRNKLRNCLLPLLEKRYNKNIKEVLGNMASSIALDYDYLQKSADALMRRMGSRIDLKKFIKLHPAMQRLILRLQIAYLKGDTRRLNFQHIKEIEALISNRPRGSIVDLPRNISVIKKKNSLLIYRRKH
ncbi:MAG: tRNA lysidine(34) synthetase TilS [Candidatus Omnitrophica bacterium]|nr:tRNA lysidine(34) synthetase TilS [Candidatus Omnitrophota bacterium]